MKMKAFNLYIKRKELFKSKYTGLRIGESAYNKKKLNGRCC